MIPRPGQKVVRRRAETGLPDVPLYHAKFYRDGPRAARPYPDANSDRRRVGRTVTRNRSPRRRSFRTGRKSIGRACEQGFFEIIRLPEKDEELSMRCQTDD